MCAKMSVKRRIISIINEEFEKQNELEIHFSPRGDWTYHDKFWSSLLELSSDKYRENYWLDSSICFRWYGNMGFVGLSFSLSMDADSKICDREKINIKSFDEDNCRKLVSTIVKKFIRYSKRNTLPYVKEHYWADHYHADDTWQNINKAVLCFLSHEFDEGMMYWNRAKAGYSNKSTVDAITYLEANMISRERLIQAIKEICAYNKKFF